MKNICDILKLYERKGDKRMEKTQKIQIGIVGYGNIGRGVECVIAKNVDMELAGIFTRRNPASVQTISGTKSYHMDELSNFKNKIDVLILCGGSATDLPEQGPKLAQDFCTIDSFDTHAKVPEYFEAMNNAALTGDNISIISVGWDPGLFSLLRTYAEAVIPEGNTYTFWGKGVSQGHSDAIRRIEGVKNAVQYTVPIEAAVDAVRSGVQPELTTREKHLRECYVVLEDGADEEKVKRAICEMPNYFSDYDTTVTYITEEELATNHGKMPHGGFVIRSGETSPGTKQLMEFSLQLDSNPEFTAGVLVAYARAAYKMKKKGATGAMSVFDVAPTYLMNESAADLRKRIL